MVRSWVALLCLFVCLPLACDGVRPSTLLASSSSSVCSPGELPPNLHARPLSEYIDDMLERSPAFRQQCEQIAHYGQRLRVTVSIVKLPAAAGYRANARIRKFTYGFIDAAISIGFGENYVELLAHEFEHVLEQAEGVDLSAQSEIGEAIRIDRGIFESCRAAAAGQLVWNQYQAAAPAGIHPKTR
jgi:hypothetical protein